MKTSEVIIVCEGKTDQNKLENLGFNYFLLTNGRNLDKTFYMHLDLCMKSSKYILILTDPDNVGAYLRKEILNFIESSYGQVQNKVLSILLEKQKAYDGNKFGIANSDSTYLKEVIEEKLGELEYDKQSFDAYDIEAYFKQFDKSKIVDKFQLKTTTSKGVYKFVQMCEFNNEEIKDCLYD